MDLGESNLNVLYDERLRNLPERTQHVYELLVAAAAAGMLVHTTAELASICGTSRVTLHKHLVRLQLAGLMGDLGIYGCESKAWRKVRWIGPRGVYNHTTRTTPRLQTSHYVFSKGKGKEKANPKDMEKSRNRASSSSVYSRSPEAAAPLLEERSMRFANASSVMNDDNTLESVFDGRHAPRRVNISHLPQYPGGDAFPPVHVPPMPRLQPGVHAEVLLERAWKAACWKKYGRKPRHTRPSGTTDAQWKKEPQSRRFRMRNAGKLLLQHDIRSPYGWALFRLNSWLLPDNVHKNKPPSIDYVFSPKAIRDLHGMYKRKCGSSDVLNLVRLTPSHQRMVELWERARCAAASPVFGADGRENTEAAVARVIPPELWHDLAQRVPGERHEIEADLMRRLAAGEWIW